MGSEATLSGSPTDTYPFLKNKLINEMKSLDGLTVPQESLLYPQMLENLKTGLAVDGYGAMAFYHNENINARVLNDLGQQRTVRFSPRASESTMDYNSPWANVLLANPVSVVNPFEELTRTAKGLKYTDVNESIIKGDEVVYDDLDELRLVKGQIADLKKREKELSVKVKDYIGDNDTLTNEDGEVIATWKMTKPTMSLNTKALMKDEPEIYRKYAKERKASRRFILKEV